MSSETAENRQVFGPEKILEMGFSPAVARVLHTSLQFAVFTHIDAGHHTVAELVSVTGASARGMRMLLDTLTSFQLLSKSGEGYQLSPLSAAYLVRGKPDYIGAVMESEIFWNSWSHLTEVVRTGEPFHRVESQQLAEQFFPLLVRSLHVINREPARRAAAVLLKGQTDKELQVLDVACGSAVWGIAMAEASANVKLTLQDFPGVFETTREYLQRHGVQDRCEFLPGELKEVDFGVERFDLALLGNIVHSEGDVSSRNLFARLYRALKPGGKIVIIDMIPNDERTGPPFALIFAINMLLQTKEGDTYTLAEYRQWLTEAGFTSIETADIASHSPLIIGVK